MATLEAYTWRTNLLYDMMLTQGHVVKMSDKMFEIFTEAKNSVIGKPYKLILMLILH